MFLALMVQTVIALTFSVLITYVMADTLPFIIILWRKMKRDFRNQFRRSKDPAPRKDLWKVMKRSREVMSGPSLSKICARLFEKDFVDTLNAYLLEASMEEQVAITNVMTALAKDEENSQSSKMARPGVADGLVRPDQLQHLYAWMAFNCKDRDEAKKLFEYFEKLWEVCGEPWHRMERTIEVQKKVPRRPKAIKTAYKVVDEEEPTQIGLPTTFTMNSLTSLFAEESDTLQSMSYASTPFDFQQGQRFDVQFGAHDDVNNTRI
ncbi:hypothetical protein CYMTET_38163 [Cymbomonas tetramitiformis]|nr:hypothetical protein CYMTET_38163 [Cymbomonas tetramitiformis]